MIDRKPPLSLSIFILAGYLFLKFCAYAFWCYRGIERFQPGTRSAAAAALRLGALRSFLGLGFGFLIWFGALLVVFELSPSTLGQAVAYSVVYVPIRWIEWSVILIIILSPARTIKGFFVGLGKDDRLWRVGGVAISCLADVPLIAAVGGLPVGRFMC